MPEITPFHHPVLGPLVSLSGLTPKPLRLTPQEARTLALALAAVARGQSQAEEIYLSPLASDDEFHGLRSPDGLVCNGISLSWSRLEQMADTIQKLLSGGGGAT